MGIVFHLPDAGRILHQKFIPLTAESMFQFNLNPTQDFMTNGVVANDEFVSTVDGPPVVKSFRNMTIQAGHTVRPTNRCKGMYLYIAGDLIIDGELTMTARGAKGPGKYVGIDPRLGVFINSEDIFTAKGFAVIHPTGGAGAPTRTISSGNQTTYVADGYAGSPGINGACGGGGGGGCAHRQAGYSTGGAGSAGTSFSGGAGGGGAASAARTLFADSGQPNGGSGGNGRCDTIDMYARPRAAGGGAGNPGGIGHRLCPPAGHPKYFDYAAYSGENGTGGLLILVVHGDIIFGPAGKITSNGSGGGKGHNASGGGSGGGAIHIFHKGIITDPTKIQAQGGAGATSAVTTPYARGGTGGAGSIVITKI